MSEPMQMTRPLALRQRLQHLDDTAAALRGALGALLSRGRIDLDDADTVRVLRRVQSCSERITRGVGGMVGEVQDG